MAELPVVDDDGLPLNISDREFKKFELDVDGKVRVRTIGNTSITDNTPAGYSTAKYTDVEVVDFEWRALPGSIALNRASIGIQNISGFEIKIRFDVMDITDPYSGWRMIDNAEFFLDMEETAICYARSAPGSGTVTVGIMEFIK